MTYRELIRVLQTLTPDELEMEATIWVQRCFPVREVSSLEDDGDLPAGHIILEAEE